MKYLNFTLVLFLISTSAKGQNSINLNNPISFEAVRTMAKKMNNATLDLSKTEGSPYFNDSFKSAVLNLKNIEAENQLWLRYNGYNDEIEIGKSEKQLSSNEALLKRKDIRASFDDKTYQYKTFTTKKGTTIDGYLVILYEGKRYSLFRQDKKKLSEGEIYDAMLMLSDDNKKITGKALSKLLGVSDRTIYRNMNNELKKEKKLLNELLKN